MKEKWLVYTDGACAPTNPGPCAWGVAVIHPETKEVAQHKGYIGHGTKPIAEITAAIEGLRLTPEDAIVELHSYNECMIKGLSEWRRVWERRGFKTAKGEQVANLLLWKELFDLADARKVTCRFVRRHLGDAHSKLANQLAGQALAEQRQAA